MIIHKPQIMTRDGKVTVSARIEPKQDIPQFPQTLWFSFLDIYGPWVSDRSDGFVVGVLKMAMYFNEPLEVRGDVSPLLAYNLDEYQRIFNWWYPDQLNIIDVVCKSLKAPLPEKANGSVGASFSGGVDSMFTLYQHLPQNQFIPSAQVTHLLFNRGINRVDFDLNSYQAALGQFEEMGKRLNVSVIAAHTNARDLSEPWLAWRTTFNASLIGTPLVLSNLFSKYLIPGHVAFTEIDRPNGSSAVVDHFLSTETMEIIHHGSIIDRAHKIAAISHWEEVQNNLRVCLNHKENFGVNNCSRCEKCMRTMIMIKMVGELEKFRTFRQPFKYWDILRLGPHYNALIPLKWFTAYALENKKYLYLPPIIVAFIIGWFKNMATMYLPEFIKRPLKKLVYSDLPREKPVQ